jgi:hypothetical protein
MHDIPTRAHAGIRNHQFPVMHQSEADMNYRGSRGGLKRVKVSIPNVVLTNDVEAEEVTITISL